MAYQRFNLIWNQSLDYLDALFSDVVEACLMSNQILRIIELHGAVFTCTRAIILIVMCLGMLPAWC
jgi:hypothetical protein